MAGRAAGAHTFSWGGQLQEPVSWQGLVADTQVVVRARASCGHTGSSGGPGRQHALLWVQGLTRAHAWQQRPETGVGQVQSYQGWF